MIPYRSRKDDLDGWQSFLHARLSHLEHEVFTVMLFDRRGFLFCVRDLFIGDAVSVNVSIKEVLRFVLVSNSDSIIVAHNHPCGWQLPSGADIELTARLRLASKVCGFLMRDHVIVTSVGVHSMKRLGPWAVPFEFELPLLKELIDSAA